MNASKRRRNKKAATAGAVLLAVVLAATACSGTNTTTNTPNEQQGTVSEGPVVDKLPDGSGVIEPDVSAPEPTADTSNSGSTEDPAADEVKRGEGTFNGLMDSHSIEIETEAGAMPLQITAELTSTIENLPSDAKVAFEYTEKAIEGEAGLKQYWLVKIEQIK